MKIKFYLLSLGCAKNLVNAEQMLWLLCEKGYTLDKVQPVDMFCWTSGVECVARFTKE